MTTPKTIKNKRTKTTEQQSNPSQLLPTETGKIPPAPIPTKIDSIDSAPLFIFPQSKFSDNWTNQSDIDGHFHGDSRVQPHNLPTSVSNSTTISDTTKPDYSPGLPELALPKSIFYQTQWVWVKFSGHRRSKCTSGLNTYGASISNICPAKSVSGSSRPFQYSEQPDGHSTTNIDQSNAESPEFTESACDDPNNIDGNCQHRDAIDIDEQQSDSLTRANQRNTTIKSKLYRQQRPSTTVEHPSRGLIHIHNNRLRTIHNISSNKRKFLRDHLLTGNGQNIHLLLSPEYLQNILYNEKSNSTITTLRRQSSNYNHSSHESKSRQHKEYSEFDGSVGELPDVGLTTETYSTNDLAIMELYRY